ncbi:hypothetical protein NL108_007305 [Boleophthalmus pectinirostris]|uniref:protein DVR-1 n=1 Tax=Boleophthalmus pectinirostris TaxID=150288 RepID=UPI000A1C50B9|nr:protein DVR-1 [Boleophthalmus pectinirostris]KAJ0059030.1 hypothetical protein NL108_007305 [Boleophthalmus pectinirostris]
MSKLHHPAALTLALICLCTAQTAQEEEAEGAMDRGLLLDAVKTGILSSLGIEKPPVVHKKASQTELREMERLYQEKLTELGLNMNRSNGMSTLLLPHRVSKLPAGHGLDLRRRPFRWHRAEFTEKPSIQEELSLLHAQLYMSRQVLQRAAARVKVHIQGSRSTRHAVWTHTWASGDTTQTLALDISDEVQKWIRDDSGPLVVEVGHRGADYNFNISLKLTQKHAISRMTRSNKEEEECDDRELCCRQSMTVSFKDIGWTDWVVAPLEYTMHFCQGSCPHNYRPASMHTQVKSRLAQISKGGISRPCCVPAAYQPMVLMHYDSHGKLKLTPFEDLIVSKCHCA